MGYFEPEGDGCLFSMLIPQEQKNTIGNVLGILAFYGILIFFVLAVIGILTIKQIERHNSTQLSRQIPSINRAGIIDNYPQFHEFFEHAALRSYPVKQA